MTSCKTCGLSYDTKARKLKFTGLEFRCPALNDNWWHFQPEECAIFNRDMQT